MKNVSLIINRKSLIIKAISILLLVAIQLTGFPVISFAQETTPSAALAPETTPTPTGTPLPDNSELTPPIENSVFDNLPSQDSNLAPSLLNSQSSQTSASFGLPVRVHQLSKRNFRADEKITIIVENAATDNVKIQLFDVDGNEVAVEMEKVSAEDPAVFRLIPPKQFKAGRYRLTITDPTGQVTNQNFTWGVLAINTNKSIYLPNEIANIAMAVLDETGMMICDASVELRIKNQELGIDDMLSTSNGKIVVNPDCSVKDFTEKPDYEANYQVQNAGFYDMTLTAKTNNGTYSITDGFDVRDSVAFDVERVNATRIFPPVTYSSIFNITANEDFTGTITETVPDSFAILPTDGATFADNISSSSAQVQEEGVLEGQIPNLSLPYQGEFAISQKFGSEIRDPLVAKKYKDFGLAGHDGIDFDLPEGTPVLAADDGEVVRAMPNGDYGTTIVIQHSWGKSYYGHLSLMTAYVGKKVNKGWPIGMSGSTGLSSGPHLHFGIKPNKNDFNNGYYGKINPAPYLGLESFQSGGENIVFSSSQPESYSVRVLTWNVSLKKGDKIKLGYGYKVPNVSPQFYLLGPLQFTDNNNDVVFQETRQWQLAIDADGSGTNTVSPTTGTVSSTGNTYTFTFTAAETMNSGGIRITVPSGWTAPQTTTSGSAGYTTVSSTGITGKVDDTMDSATGWSAGTACSTTAPAADTTTKQEGTASIKCVNGGEASGDVWYKNITSENWGSYTTVGLWLRADAAITSNRLQFIYDDSTNCASELEALALEITTANTWEYKVLTFAGIILPAVICYGFQINHATALDNKTVWSDYLLLGSSTQTAVVTGTGPWDVDVIALQLANTNTITVTYGSGGGASGVTNSATSGTHTFTTKSRISVTGALTNIASSPTVCLSCGPTNDQLMRHGKWFNAGAEQPFTF